MISDEGAYAYWASHWTFAHQVYRDFAFARPQGILVAYKLIFALLGSDIDAIRLAAALAAALASGLMLMFAREAFSESVGCWSAVLLAAFSAAPRIEGFTANAEIFTLAPLVANAWLVWKKRWFWAGLASAFAFQLKPSGFEGCVLIAIWSYISSASLSLAAGAVLEAFCGFVIGMAPGLIHGWWIGWHDYWFSLVTLRREVFSPDVVRIGAQVHRALAGSFVTASAWAAPALLFVVGFLRAPRDVRMFSASWLLSALVGMAVGMWWDWHFFLQLMPPLTFLGGWGVVSLARIRLTVIWTTSVALCLSLFWIRDGQLWFDEPSQVSWAVYGREGYLRDRELAEYIANSTLSTDPIYVAFGDAELYYLAHREPASPGQLFYAQARYSNSAWTEAIDAVRRRLAAVIVEVQDPPAERMTPDQFRSVVDEGYALDRVVGSIRVYRRRQPH